VDRGIRGKKKYDDIDEKQETIISRPLLQLSDGEVELPMLNCFIFRELG
jgi:hypothetical protein